MTCAQIRCGGVSPLEYKKLQSVQHFAWTCPKCLSALHSLPFAEISDLDFDLDSSDSSSLDDNRNDGMPSIKGLQDVLLPHQKNFKLAHLNVNSIAGFKFYEIKSWLLSRFFDVLVLTETKIDASLPDSQFAIDGYRFMRLDRSLRGGGVMIF